MLDASPEQEGKNLSMLDNAQRFYETQKKTSNTEPINNRLAQLLHQATQWAHDSKSNKRGQQELARRVQQRLSC